MKSISITRKVDSLGRIVIPKEILKSKKINFKDPMEILVGEGTIILRKYYTNCIFCGENNNLKKFMGRKICEKCIDKIK